MSKVIEHIANLQWHSWCLPELKEIICVAVESGDATLLVKGFFTFDPVSVALWMGIILKVSHLYKAGKSIQESFLMGRKTRIHQ